MRDLAPKKKSKGRTNTKPVNKQQTNETEENITSEEAVTEEANEEIKEQVSEEELNTEENKDNAEANGDAAEAEDTEADAKDPAKAKIEELEDKVKRQLAEFDNFRKRTEKEKTGMFEAGQKSVVEKILPVVDNFERALATIKEGEESNPHAEGMQMIYKQLMTELEKMDVKPIEAVGKEFDPEFHNAVMQCESDEYDSGIVAAELQKGYTFGDSVLRHSMVSVVS